MFIASEIGQLKQVLLHRPYDVFKRLTPSNCDHFLFDDVLWPEKAAEEYDIFSHLLQSEGVEVFFVDVFLKETIKNTAAKSYLIKNVLYSAYHGSAVENLLSQYLYHLTDDELVTQLFSGITFEELAPYSLGLVSTVSKPYDFIVPPLPNQLFMRDTSSWIGSGVCINRMAFKVRQAETAIISTIYKYHPIFQPINFPIWYSGDKTTESLPSIEGGDILVINGDYLLIGLSERTQAQAVEILAKKLFQANQITEILAVEIPRQRSSMHLDTLLTFVDYDAVCSIYPDLDLNCWSIQSGDNDIQLRIKKEKTLSHALKRILTIKSIRIISPLGDAFSLEREQWNDAVNLLALRPGKVLAYEQNQLTNKALEKAGIEVITFAASELSRGRGGSHCMSCPLTRAPLC